MWVLDIPSKCIPLHLENIAARSKLKLVRQVSELHNQAQQLIERFKIDIRCRLVMRACKDCQRRHLLNGNAALLKGGGVTTIHSAVSTTDSGWLMSEQHTLTVLWDFPGWFTIRLHPWPHLIPELYTSFPAEPASQPSGSKGSVVVSQSSFIQLWR